MLSQATHLYLTLCLVALAAWAVVAWLRQWRGVLSLREQLVSAHNCAYFARLAADSAYDGLVVQSLDGTILWANPAYCAMTGRTLDFIIGRNPLTFVMPPDQTPDARAISGFRYDTADPEYSTPHLRRNCRADGTLYWAEISVSFQPSPQGDMLAILVCRDATTQVEREKQLQRSTADLANLASRDGLTGIANRATLMRRATEAMAAARASGGTVGMLHLDLDKFKEINDTHGHSAGDAILVHVAQILRESVRRGDLVARIGGDEFVVLCLDVQSLDDLRQVAEELRRALAVPLRWRGRTLPCRASIGAAISDDGTTTPEDVLQRADFALYEVKRSGRGRAASYDEGLHKRHNERVRLSAELTEAVQSRGLDFHFQPMIDGKTGRVRCVETLVRWAHPRLGALPPSDFLPLAQDLGLMAEVDMAAMDAALDLKMQFNRLGHEEIHVAINASAALLSHPDFVPRLTYGVLARMIEPAQVEIEVLETIVFDDVTADSPHARIISDLSQAGYVTMLDDFGVGHAGLAHLAQLAISGVKIDRTLIRNMPADPTSTKIVATMIDLCADLDIAIVAEGIETAEQARALVRLGCDTLQGFWVGRPMPVDDLFGWIDAAKAAGGALADAALPHQIAG